MPQPNSDENPKKGRARKAMREIASRALGALAAKTLADAVREVFDWLTN